MVFKTPETLKEMKPIGALILAFVITIGAFGQDDQTLSKKELRQLQKEQKKAEADAAREAALVITRAMIEHQKFVLEADFLSDKRGQRVPVQATINFIMIDSNRSTVQFGSAMTIGYNGVGGATIEGNISNYKYNVMGKNKENYNVSFNFMSSLGTYDITLLVNAVGSADAQVRGNWGGQLNYHGKLVPLEISRIYKAMPMY